MLKSASDLLAQNQTIVDRIIDLLTGPHSG